MKLLRYLVMALLPTCASAQLLNNAIQQKNITKVQNGGTGAVPTAADQVSVSASTSAAAWKALADCSPNALTYSFASHTFSCVTAGGGGTPGGANTQVQVNGSGSFAGYANFTTDSSGNVSVNTLSTTASGAFGFLGSEGIAPAGASGKDGLWADSTAHRLLMNNNNAGTQSVAGIVASGSTALSTSSVSAAPTCVTTTATATGVVSTDAITWNPNGPLSGVTGYIPSTSGGLSIQAYPAANAVKFDVCNWTSSPITPGAVMINWTVAR